jgi:hypothetical protein
MGLVPLPFGPRLQRELPWKLSEVIIRDGDTTEAGGKNVTLAYR